jgi:hypothetical protein
MVNGVDFLYQASGIVAVRRVDVTHCGGKAVLSVEFFKNSVVLKRCIMLSKLRMLGFAGHHYLSHRAKEIFHEFTQHYFSRQPIKLAF